MVRFKRLFYILLLNILVSGATTLVVLYYWERNHPVEIAQVTVIVTANPALQTAQVVSTQENTDEIFPNSSTLEIETIISSPVPLIEYEVKKGDSLGKIAQAFDASLDDILLVNGLDDPDMISVGQTLYIPSAPLPTKTPIPSSTTQPTSTTRPTATYTITATSDIPPKPRIDSITGAGNLQNERIKITRTGYGELSLANWKLEDSDGFVYIFPDLTLYEGGSVVIHTTRGTDTVTDLYWGLQQPIWQPGETAILRDAAGIEHARYQIP